MKLLFAIVAVAAFSAVAKDRVIYATYPGTNTPDITKPIGVVKESDDDRRAAAEIRKMRSEMERDRRDAKFNAIMEWRRSSEDAYDSGEKERALRREMSDAYDRGYRMGAMGLDANGNPLK